MEPIRQEPEVRPVHRPAPAESERGDRQLEDGFLARSRRELRVVGAAPVRLVGRESVAVVVAALPGDAAAEHGAVAEDAGLPQGRGDPAEGLRPVRPGPEAAHGVRGIHGKEHVLEGPAAAREEVAEVAGIVVRVREAGVPGPAVSLVAGPELREPVRVQVELHVVARADQVPPLVLHPLRHLRLEALEEEVLPDLDEAREARRGQSRHRREASRGLEHVCFPVDRPALRNRLPGLVVQRESDEPPLRLERRDGHGDGSAPREAQVRQRAAEGVGRPSGRGHPERPGGAEPSRERLSPAGPADERRERLPRDDDPRDGGLRLGQVPGELRERQAAGLGLPGAAGRGRHRLRHGADDQRGALRRGAHR